MVSKEKSSQIVVLSKYRLLQIIYGFLFSPESTRIPDNLASTAVERRKKNRLEKRVWSALHLCWGLLGESPEFHSVILKATVSLSPHPYPGELEASANRWGPPNFRPPWGQ